MEKSSGRLDETEVVLNIVIDNECSLAPVHELRQLCQKVVSRHVGDQFPNDLDQGNWSITLNVEGFWNLGNQHHKALIQSMKAFGIPAPEHIKNLNLVVPNYVIGALQKLSCESVQPQSLVR